MDSTARSATGGFILVGAGLSPLYASPGVLCILAFPHDPDGIESAEHFLIEKISQVLLKIPGSPRSGFVTEFQSGSRRYSCRSFPVSSNAGRARRRANVALIIERIQQSQSVRSIMVEQYRLTPREQEIVSSLIQGLTTKEIADRMSISPNTVKAFLRLIKVKMGTSTRSGIVGKMLMSVPQNAEVTD